MNGHKSSEAPSRVLIATMTVASVATFIGEIYLGFGDNRPRDLIGWVLGFVAFYMLMGRTFDLAARRRNVWREAAIAAAEHAQERADQTGTWTGPENQPGMVLTVRWDPHLCVFLVKGWISDNYQVADEMRWWGDNWATLRRMIEEAEVDGLEPMDDEPTRAIRARLNVKGWDGPDGVQGGDWLNQELGIHPRSRS